MEWTERAVRGGALAPLLLLLWVAGCGARTGLISEESDPTPSSGTTQGTAPTTNGAPTDGDAPTPGAMGGFLGGSSQALPPCQLGVARDSATSCPFVYDELCYDTWTEACACACPPDRTGTNCVQGGADFAGTAPIKYCE